LPSFEDSIENELPAGVVGAEFNGTTDGEEADGSGASTVKVRSSVVRFVASRVNTCKLKNTVYKREESKLFQCYFSQL
jgi:hypothetical protein